MHENARAAVLAAFAADSLALGAHWIYNTNVIDRKVGRVETLLKPIVDSWHPNRDAGEFTHYGDQSLVLLESLAACGGFDLEHFARLWRQRFADYDGYVDKATKATLEHFAQGKSPAESGSASDELGGAVRIAPLIYRYHDDPDELAAAARAQTAMTHNNSLVLDGAELVARAVCKVFSGTSPTAALASAADDFGDSRLADWIEDGVDSAAFDTRQAIRDFGQMCETPAAFPATVHLVAKYEADLKAALVENVMAGGESAARGMVAGMLLGAYHGMDAIPAEWISGLRRGSDIDGMLASLHEDKR